MTPTLLSAIHATPPRRWGHVLATAIPPELGTPTVLLDGQVVDNRTVTAADDLVGWVEVCDCRVDPNGAFSLKVGEDGELIRRRLFGRVEIRPGCPAVADA